MRIFTLTNHRSLISSFTVLVALCILLVGACRKPDLEPANALTIAEAGAKFSLPAVVTVGVVRIGNNVVVTGRVESHGSTFIDTVGICFGTDPLPTIVGNRTLRLSIPRDTIPWEFRDTINSVTSVLYVRAFATNETGTAYGEALLVGNVVVTTNIEVTNKEDTSATVSGSVEGSGVGVRGIRYAPVANLNAMNYVQSSNTDSFSVDLIGLDPATNYQFQAYAYESGAIVFGATSSFRTNRCPSKLFDVDGNEYDVVEIGIKCWMKQNLRTGHCRDEGSLQGFPSPTSLIPNEATSGTWSMLTRAARCQPDTSDAPDAYGLLYNGYTVVDPRGLCPQGWEVPTSDDWLQLLQGISTGGNYTELQDPTWNNGTNSLGFSALAAGERNEVGVWSGFLGVGTWWSRTTPSNESVPIDSLESFKIDNMGVSRPPRNIKTGLSVRCIKQP